MIDFEFFDDEMTGITDAKKSSIKFLGINAISSIMITFPDVPRAPEDDVENAAEDISEPVEEEPVPGNEEHASETAGKTKSQGPAQLYRRPDDELFRHGTQQGGRNPETEL